ncbi:MAG: hypothetical protein LBS30_01595 [Planctomycetota bacterium]|jgi:hypothetical protein|nr:hypothetical protein [Planctomycetota bacterium]
MQIGGLSDNSMIYQQYAEMARQRRLAGAVGMEETDDVQDAAEINYAAAMQQMEAQQIQQAQEVAPSMEVGDRASPDGNVNPGDMFRMLNASARGFNPASSSEAASAAGAAGTGNSFWNEILKSFSDVGAYSRASAPASGPEFTNYMKNLVNNAYGM